MSNELKKAVDAFLEETFDKADLKMDSRGLHIEPLYKSIAESVHQLTDEQYLYFVNDSCDRLSSYVSRQKMSMEDRMVVSTQLIILKCFLMSLLPGNLTVAKHRYKDQYYKLQKECSNEDTEEDNSGKPE